MLRDGYRPLRRTRRRCLQSSLQRPKKPQQQPQETVLDEITVEANDGSCLHEDDGNSSMEENHNQGSNKLQAYSNGRAEIDAPHKVDDDFETLFGQIDSCDDLKVGDLRLARKQASTIVKRIIGIRLKDGRFIPKRGLNVRKYTWGEHRRVDLR